MEKFLKTLILSLSLFISISSYAQFYESTIGLPLQPGQFRSTDGVAVDGNGNIFVVDAASCLITKFDSNGNPLAQWGASGFGDGQFNNPQSIALDVSGNVYVGDNNRIQKFSNTGVFITKWGSSSNGDGQFNYPRGLAVDASGNVYVADTYNYRIQKFSNTGTFISKWGSSGSGDGQFSYPQGLAVDASGNVYVADTENHRIQKFSNTGTFISKWGSSGNGDGLFSSPRALAVDASGNVYVADTYNYRIQKFSNTGTFISKWGSYGNTDGQFSYAQSLAVDASGNVYVADTYNYRIQKFSNTGTFISKLISSSLGNSQFNFPGGLAIDASGNVYIADTYNHRIQKFNSTGVFITKWGSFGIGNGQFSNPRGITVDASGDVYVADWGNDRIQKFNNAGIFISSWGTNGASDGQFYRPNGIAIDQTGNIYVTDNLNNRIQKFNSSGVFITKWGSYGDGDGQFTYPERITSDASGDIYVTDGTRVQKFSNAGAFKAKWQISASGCYSDIDGNIWLTVSNSVQKISNIGTLLLQWDSADLGNNQLNFLRDIAIDGTEHAYVADTYNHRIQKFSILNITSTSPLKGIEGSSITIYGSGFSLTPSENIMKFNGAIAATLASTITSLTVKVPTGATTGKISVTRESTTVTSATEFLVLPLTISSSIPRGSAIGTSITITGTGFSSINENNIVKFNGVTATVTSSSPTSLKAVVPNTTKGKITVTVLGQTATSIDDFIITKLAITGLSYNEFYSLNEPSTQVSVTVNDINEVQSVRFKSKGITQDDSKIKSDDVTFSTIGNAISFSVPASYFTDPLGLIFSYAITEKLGNEILSPVGYMYLEYPSSSTMQIIPDLNSGKKISAYQLIAIPLELKVKSIDNVFNALKKSDNRKWRLFSYENEVLNEKPSLIETGKGYWFIMRDKTEINPGDGTTVKVTPANPYTITLKNGWNLIGNPYNFTISWNDVVESNSLDQQAFKFRQFRNGKIDDEPLLNRYRGAFVYSNANIDIKIPVINHSLTGSRSVTKEQPSALDAPTWQTNLTLNDGEFENSLFGFGMNPKAIEQKDNWDETSLPILEGLSSFSMNFREVQNNVLVIDIVNTQENYTWQASLSSEHGVTLQWDNSYFGDNDKQLILENTSQVELVDMRKAIQTSIPAGSHILKFHFGDPSYIKSQVLETTTRFGKVYPNPVIRGISTININVSLPEGSNTVSLHLMDLYGSASLLSGKGTYDGGRSLLTWQNDFSSISSGIYILKVEVKNRKGIRKIVNTKVVIE